MPIPRYKLMLHSQKLVDLPAFLGRPLVRSLRFERNLVIELLTSLGPSTGMPALQSCCPGMPRSELDDLLRRFRRVYQKKHQRRLHVLHWSCPGTVWAMDFAQAPSPVDGQYPYLFAVRDRQVGIPVIHQERSETLDALLDVPAHQDAALRPDRVADEEIGVAEIGGKQGAREPRAEAELGNL